MILRRLFWAWSAMAGAPGGDHGGRVVELPSDESSDLPEAAELEVLGHGQGLRDADEHALVALERASARSTGKVMSVGATVVAVVARG